MTSANFRLGCAWGIHPIGNLKIPICSPSCFLKDAVGLGLVADVRAAATMLRCWQRKTQLVAPHGNAAPIVKKGRNPMTLPEITLVATFITGLAIIRFGLPIALTWLVGRAADTIEHLPS